MAAGEAAGGSELHSKEKGQPISAGLFAFPAIIALR
jgi:hypothetical protein